MSRAVALLAAAIFVAACGATTEAVAPSPSPAASPSPSTGPSPAGQTFQINGIKTTASGTAILTRGTGSFTLELKITGLAPDSSHISHIHVGSCQQVGGIMFALKQVVADGNGAADATTTVTATYPPASGHWYVVVHAGVDMQGANAAYLLCGNLF